MERLKLKWIIVSLVLAKLAAGVSTSLEGRRARCNSEGEPIDVGSIDKMKCYSCICKNGYVECKSDTYCPPVEGCHMLVDKSSDGCCRKCKGCIYNGVHHLSHTEWTDPNNPCKVYRCEAGVVTESDLKCYTPCANPLPPEPGKCCPTCSECKINGQIATDDRDVIADDPCLNCRCSRGRMTCAKKACPVLQCNSEHQYHPSGECCPRCKGTRSRYAVPKSCTIQRSFFREGQSFKIDKWTECVCKNETSVCKRAACPVLDCSPDLQLNVPGSSCKKCSIPEEMQCQCNYGGKTYQDGESWQLDACRSCKCHKGMPSCAMTRCNVTFPCPAGTKLQRIQGECCDKCVEVEGVCMVFGDLHYKTFDGKIYTFQGIGKYQLVTDCKNQSFSVRVANENLNKSLKSSTSTRRVALHYGDVRVNLQQRGRVKINRKRIKLPYKKEGKIQIEKIDGQIHVTLNNDVKILWDGKNFVEVSVPASFKNGLCGLCGNFNGNAQDELMTKRGRVVKDSEVLSFAHSWCAGCKARCAELSRTNKQRVKQAQCYTHRSEKNRCKFINNLESFGECEAKLNAIRYYKTCKTDMCNCPNGKCYCDSLMAYSRECERLGVKIPPDWKKVSFCDGEQKHSKPTKKPAFTQEEIERFRMQRMFNRTKSNPILIN